MIGGFQVGPFQTNFQQQSTVIVVDTHDGFDGKRKEYRKRIEEREHLRTQLEEAFASPKRLARKPVIATNIQKMSADDDDDWVLLTE